MDFDLNDEQTMLRDLVARFAGDAGDLADRKRARLEPRGFSAARWRMLGDLGLLAMPFDEARGGLGGGRIETITVMEALGRGLCIEPYLSDLLLGGRLLQEAGTAAQQAAWLPGIMTGDLRLTLAHFEHQARFNPLYVRCEARGAGDAARLHGAKTFVMAAEGADGYIVSARDDGGPDDPAGLSLWLVAADAAGIERRSYRLADGSVAAELRLHGVPGDRLAGGAPALLAAFDEARIAACAEMVGLMAMLFEATLEHVRTRKQFGQPIGSFQAIQHRMADLYILLEQSRSQMLRAALVRTEGPAPVPAVAAAKSFVGASAVRLGEECIQFHGGMGTSDELALGHGHKRILVLATLLGDAESELARYARLVA